MLNHIQRRFGSGAQSIGAQTVNLHTGRRGTFRAPVAVGRVSALLGLAIALLMAAPTRAADTLNWETNRNRVTADIKAGKLIPLLEQIASVTGWHVFVEPDRTRTISVKFSNLPPGEALHLLLGDLNFALVPQTNASSKPVRLPHRDQECDTACAPRSCRRGTPRAD